MTIDEAVASEGAGSLEELRTRIAALSPGKRALLARRLAAGSPPTGERRLVAYLVPDPERPSGVDQVRAFLREKLPAHLVPVAFEVLDALPRIAAVRVQERDGATWLAPRSTAPEKIRKN